MKPALSFLLILAGAYSLICLLAFVFQARLIYFPQRGLSATPSEVGLEYRDVEFGTDDGRRLHGWFLPAPESHRVLLFFHGNAGTISHRLASLRAFHDLGLSVLIFDYRGYGKSTGSPTEPGLYLDARGAWRYLVEVEGYPAHDVVFFGRSLGGAVAVELATQCSPGAVILESTFTTLPDVGARAYPWLPVRWLSRHHYDSLSRIGRIRCPKLFVHSRRDEVVPFELGRRLFDAAPEPKEFLELSGGHNDGFWTSEEPYGRTLQEFLARTGGTRPSEIE